MNSVSVQTTQSSIPDGDPKPLDLRLSRDTNLRRLQNAWEEIYQRQGIFEREPFGDFGKTTDILKARGARTVIDAACGTGRHLIPLLQAGFDVYGFDLSPTALQYAKAEILRNGLPLPDLQVHDMFEKWPYPRVDAVLVFNSIYHGYKAEVERTIRFIHEDVLQPGGTLIFTTTMNPLRSARGANLTGLEIEDIFDIPEQGTFVPRIGEEAGLPHHIFDPDEIFAMLDGKFAQVHIKEAPNSYLLVDARANGVHTTGDK